MKKILMTFFWFSFLIFGSVEAVDRDGGYRIVREMCDTFAVKFFMPAADIWERTDSTIIDTEICSTGVCTCFAKYETQYNNYPIVIDSVDTNISTPCTSFTNTVYKTRGYVVGGPDHRFYDIWTVYLHVDHLEAGMVTIDTIIHTVVDTANVAKDALKLCGLECEAYLKSLAPDTGYKLWLIKLTTDTLDAGYIVGLVSKADTALFSWLADSARNSATWQSHYWGEKYPVAEYADTAGHALVGFVVWADSAWWAVIADTAIYAKTASFCTTAQNSWQWNGHAWGYHYPYADTADYAKYIACGMVKEGSVDTSAVGTGLKVEILSEWVSPTGHKESAIWFNEPQAYDDDITTYTTLVSYAIGQWSGPLKLDISPSAWATKIKYYLDAISDSVWLDLDARIDGVWTDLYECYFTDSVWEEKSFSKGEIDSISLRFKHAYKDIKDSMFVHEVKIYDEKECPFGKIIVDYDEICDTLKITCKPDSASYADSAGHAQDSDSLNHHASSYYLNTSSNAQTKSGKLTLNGTADKILDVKVKSSSLYKYGAIVKLDSSTTDGGGSFGQARALQVESYAKDSTDVYGILVDLTQYDEDSADSYGIKTSTCNWGHGVSKGGEFCANTKGGTSAYGVYASGQNEETGPKIGVHGTVNSTGTGMFYGIRGIMPNNMGASDTSIAVYGDPGVGADISWAGYFNGNVKSTADIYADSVVGTQDFRMWGRGSAGLHFWWCGATCKGEYFFCGDTIATAAGSAARTKDAALWVMGKGNPGGPGALQITMDSTDAFFSSWNGNIIFIDGPLGLDNDTIMWLKSGMDKKVEIYCPLNVTDNLTVEDTILTRVVEAFTNHLLQVGVTGDTIDFSSAQVIKYPSGDIVFNVVRPDASHSGNIGAESYYYHNGYFDFMHIDSTLYVDGNVNITGNLKAMGQTIWSENCSDVMKGTGFDDSTYFTYSAAAVDTALFSCGFSYKKFGTTQKVDSVLLYSGAINTNLFTDYNIAENKTWIIRLITEADGDLDKAHLIEVSTIGGTAIVKTWDGSVESDRKYTQFKYFISPQ